MESGKHSIDSLGDCIISIENTEQTDVANCQLLDHCLNENDECVRLEGQTRDVNGKCVTALDPNHTNTDCQSLDHCLNENDECVMLGSQTRDVNGKRVPAPDPNHTNTNCPSLDHCLNENDECVMLEGQLRSNEGKCQRSDLSMCPDKHCIDKSSLKPQCRPLDNTLRLSPTNGECLCVIESQELFDGKCQCPPSSCTLATDLQCLDLSAASTTFDIDLQPEEKAIRKSSTTGFCECQGADLPTTGGTSSSTSNYYIHPSLMRCETFCQGLIDTSYFHHQKAHSDVKVCLPKPNTVLDNKSYICSPGLKKNGDDCERDSATNAKISLDMMLLTSFIVLIVLLIILTIILMWRRRRANKGCEKNNISDGYLDFGTGTSNVSIEHESIQNMAIAQFPLS
ncbi:MAG: hypothetical protein MHMPM18_000177 [Marteilia pararefringens]